MDKAAAEEAFVGVLDLLEQYLALQHSLAGALRTGFLNISAGKYSMGADRVSRLQYPAQMQATSKVAVTGEGQLRLVHCELGGVGGGKPRPTPDPAAPAAAPVKSSVSGSSQSTSAAAPAGGGSGGEGRLARLSAGVEGLRLGASDTSGILHELAAKYHCSLDDEPGTGARGAGESEGDEDEAEPLSPASHLRRKHPLHWFGALVAPQLREAEKNFSEGLELAVRAASVRQQLLARLAEYKRLSLPAEGMSPAVSAA